MLNVEKAFVLDQKAGQAKEVKQLEEDGDVKTNIYEKNTFTINYFI